MNEKYSLKIIQHGKIQQIRTVQNGVKVLGQAVVVEARVAGARFQLVNLVALVSPAKLQLKRVKDALHLVLPEGDIDAPDLVIKNYFKVSSVSLQGISNTGELMKYDTTSLAVDPSTFPVGNEAIMQSMADKTTVVSLGGSSAFDTFSERPWLWVGGIAAGVAMAGASGGGGASTDTSPLGAVKAYADVTNDPSGAGSTALASDYAKIGLTKVDGTALNTVNAANSKVIGLMNDVVGRLDVTKVDTVNELSSIEKAAENVFATSTGGGYGLVSYVGATVDADWVAGLTSLGVAGASARDITAIKVALRAKDVTNDGTAVDTVAELQTIVSAVRIDSYNNDAAALGTKSQTAYVDLGYRGVDKDNLGLDIKHRSKFKSLTDEEKKSLKRREAIEPIIGHLKANHRMNRCHLKGSNGDSLHAVLCAAGFNIRWLLRMIANKRIGLFLRLLKASGLGHIGRQLREIFIDKSSTHSSMRLAQA